MLRATNRALVFAVVACACTALPPSTPPRSHGPSTAPTQLRANESPERSPSGSLADFPSPGADGSPPGSRPSPALSLVVPSSPFASDPIEPPLLEPTPIVARFVEVALPRDVAPVVAVDGRNDQDVWIVTSDNAVLHWDGSRIRRRAVLQCHTDACCGRLVDCAKLPQGACQAECSNGAPQCAPLAEFSHVRVGPRDVVVSAYVQTGGLRPSLVAARLLGGFQCEQQLGDLVYPGSGARGEGPNEPVVVKDDVTFRVGLPAHLVNPLGGYALFMNGRRVPLPPDSNWWSSFQFAAPDDIWLDNSRMWRGNGITWEPVEMGIKVATHWVDGSDRIWVLGNLGQDTGAQLLHQNRDQDGWTQFAVPRAETVVGEGHDTFFVLGQAYYYWNGSELGTFDMPIQPKDTWYDSGKLWIGGERDGRGALYYWAPPGSGVRP